MTDIRKQISQFIENQFPDIYREDGESMVAFLTAYYEFLETNDKYSHHVNRRLSEYSDIDETLDEFVIFFKKKYLADFPYLSSTDTRFLIKHIIDEYRSKGSDQSLRLLMQLLFGEKVEVYYPGQDVLKPSDSKWVVPRYVEVTHSDRTPSFLGKRVYSDRFNASGIVENVITKRVSSKIIDLVYLSDIDGEFHTGDVITDEGGDLTDTPTVIGSLTTIEITNGGSQFKIGDILKLVSSTGKDGEAKVTELATQTDVVTFVNNDGGFGYTLDGNTVIYTANSMLFMNNSTQLPLKSTVSQHLETLTVSTTSGVLLGANAVHTTNTSIYGAVVAFSSLSNTITINPVAGTFVGQANVLVSGNNYVVSASVSANTQGIVVGNASDRVGIYRTIAQQFYSGSTGYNAYVSTSLGTRAVTRVGTGSGASFLIGSLADTQNITVNTDMIAGYTGVALNAADYGFSAGAPVENLSSVIGTSLNYDTFTIGSIASFKNLNPGLGYNTSIFVLVDNPEVSAYDYTDYVITITNPTRSFVAGDIVSQANTVFGKVKSALGDKIYVRNQTFGNIKFTANSTPILSDRGASATITASISDYSAPQMGYNAFISGDVKGETGSVSKVAIVSSGIGYNDGDEVVMQHVPSFNQIENINLVEGIARLGNGGKQTGYWETVTSHLNEVDIRIRDNKYYQEFSYDIIASVSFDKYEKLIRDVLHVAGTKMFGSVAKVSEVSISSVASTEIRTTQLATSFLEANGANLLANTAYVTVQTEVEV